MFTKTWLLFCIRKFIVILAYYANCKRMRNDLICIMNGVEGGQISLHSIKWRAASVSELRMRRTSRIASILRCESTYASQHHYVGFVLNSCAALKVLMQRKRLKIIGHFGIKHWSHQLSLSALQLANLRSVHVLWHLSSQQQYPPSIDRQNAQSGKYYDEIHVAMVHSFSNSPLTIHTSI